MKGKIQSERIIFGLKVRQLRQKQQLSYADLSKLAKVSISYLNEIEKGKKYPKKDKIEALANVLGVSYQQLTSSELGSHLAPVAELLQSNFLNDLPLELFGIDISKVVEIIASAPSRVGAFISTLLEISRNYALQEEHFYFGALRSYLELHNNYFPEIEDAVTTFKLEHNLPEETSVSGKDLRDILENGYDYQVRDNGLKNHKELQAMRSIFLKNKKELLLNGNLSDIQKSFEFGKEVGFNYLKLQERAATSSLVRPKTFEEVLNHSKSIYFSVAMRLPLHPFAKEITNFFEHPNYQGELLLNIMKKYKATPEILFHRLTNILPAIFGIKKLFFLRFTYNAAKQKYRIDRELHLAYRHPPHSNGLSEHYCRRWITISLLHELENMQKEGIVVEAIVRAQRSKFENSNNEYLNLTIARPGHADQPKNVSVTIGMLIDKNLSEKIHFLEDTAIHSKIVNRTCERCAIADCKERAADPTVIQQKENLRQIQDSIRALDVE